MKHCKYCGEPAQEDFCNIYHKKYWDQAVANNTEIALKVYPKLTVLTRKYNTIPTLLKDLRFKHSIDEQIRRAPVTFNNSFNEA